MKILILKHNHASFKSLDLIFQPICTPIIDTVFHTIATPLGAPNLHYNNSIAACVMM